MKRLNASASLQALTGHQILTAMAMFEWSSKNNPGIKFFFVSNKDVYKNVQRFGLHERWESKSTIPGTRSKSTIPGTRSKSTIPGTRSKSTIPGTRSLHCCIPTPETSLEMKRISADLVGTAISERNVPDEKDFGNAELQVGKYITCLYDKEWYIGCIVTDQRGRRQCQFYETECSRQTIMATHHAGAWLLGSLCDNVLCIVNTPDFHTSAHFYELNAGDHQCTTRKFEAWRVTLGNPQVLQ